MKMNRKMKGKGKTKITEENNQKNAQKLKITKKLNQ